MANSGNQKQKLLHLMRMLEAETDSQHGLTMNQIIERFEAQGYPAERKAVYRDLDALREVGFDIRKLSARPVQYALFRNELGIDDVMLLVDLVQSSPFLTDKKSYQLTKGLKRLVSEHERKKLSKRVHVQDRIRNQNESVFHSVDTIHAAMQGHRKIEFLYYSFDTKLEQYARHDGKLYVVTPVKISYVDSFYYLSAYDDEEECMKTYRIDRMRIAQISEEKATRNEYIASYDFSEAAYLSFNMFHGKGKRVTLRVKEAFVDAIVDRFGRDVEIARSTASYVDVRVDVRVSPQFFGWIASLDGGVTIRTPKKLVEEYNEWLKGLVATHD